MTIATLVVAFLAVAPSPCARPNLPARSIRVVEPDTPPIAQQQGISGTVSVIVTLDELSHVTAARIQSSPSAVLNAAALAAVRASTYQAEIRDCKPRAGEYFTTVEFFTDGALPSVPPLRPAAPAATPLPVWRESLTAAGEPTVVVAAEGVARRMPDVAYVDASIVTTDDDNPAVAASRNDAIFAAVTAKLHALGIDDTNIRAALSPGMTILPQRPSAPERFPPAPTRFGRESTRKIVITVSAVANAPAVADAVYVAGAKAVSTRYDVLDRETAYREAVASAVRAAEARAHVVAKSGGFQLGRLYQVRDYHADGPPSYSVQMVSPGGTARLTSPPAPVDVRTTVSVTYVIKP